MKPFKLLFALGSCILGLNANAQSKLDLDSLLTVLKTQKIDTLKVQTLNEIVNYYMYRDNEEAEKYAKEELELSEMLDYKIGEAMALYQIGVVYSNRDDQETAKAYYERSLVLAKDLEYSIFISKALRALAILEFHQGNLQAADSINDIDLDQAISSGDSLGIALAYDFKGTINQNRGYYSIALENVLKGLKLFETLKDSIRIADTMNHLATLEYNLGNYQKSIDYNTIALSIYEDFDDLMYQATALNDIGVMNLRLGNLEKALAFFDRSLLKSNEAGITGIKIASLTNIGDVYNQLGRPELAIEKLTTAIDLGIAINADRRVAIARNSIGEAYLSIGNPRKALEEINLAHTYAVNAGSESIRQVSLRNFSNIYENMGQTSKAFNYFKEFKDLSDSLLNEEKIKTIESLRFEFDLEKKESAIALQEEEIKTLNAQKKAESLKKTIYAGGMFSFLAVAGGLFFGFRQRIKRNLIAREKQEEIYQNEIAHKKKELASQTLHLVQKNTFLEELQENLQALRQSPEKFKMEFRRIAMLLKKEKASDRDWETFKTYFSEVHNDFDQKLKTLADKITEKEIRLAAFLRMNLTTKEIAATMNVLPDSILKSKYRLKKKLGLEPETDLVAFLNSL